MRFLDVFRVSFQKTFTTFRKKPAYIFQSSLIDVLFVVIFGAFLNELILRIQYLIILIFEATQESSSIEADVVFSGFTQINDYIRLIFIYLGIFMVVLYVCYSLFKGLNWKIGKSLLKKESRLVDYLKINIIWFGLIAAVLFSLASTVLFNLFEAQTILYVFLRTLGILALINIVIFIPISYALGSVKRTLAIGYKRFHYFLVYYLIVAAVFALINYILILAYQNTVLMMSLGFIMVFPAMAFFRILLINLTYQVSGQYRSG